MSVKITSAQPRVPFAAKSMVDSSVFARKVTSLRRGNAFVSKSHLICDEFTTAFSIIYFD